ncbi:hypothetical protein [Candidatus Mycoplasma haematohominis]|uniref:Uncharacterized protein n=1 Tax=Candidatus Mycoplasma haematohominis TaxID=1494318 RepID=A0A478FVK9_9MOLU|nr:hypothetical protein [Candidatus Mycoplasma haemohominis]GCE64050.1 hypothetical protein MHSWG343_10580 [Candidatus Mycoplasma haemohominis]
MSITSNKITLISAITGNGIFTTTADYELLKAFMWKVQSDDESLSPADNTYIEDIKPIRKKKNTAVLTSKGKLDPRNFTQVNPRVVKANHNYLAFHIFHISSYTQKLVSWKPENKTWWEKSYEHKKYILENHPQFKGSKITSSYKPDKAWLTNNEFALNQFCDVAYDHKTFFEKFKDLFWLACSIDGKNPEEKDDSKWITEINKAQLPTSGSAKTEITYLTVKQSKKTNTWNLNNKEDKFIVYDYNKEWWEWSYKNRLEVDRKDENSYFPLTTKFKDATKGWEENASNENSSLNNICKELYAKNGRTADETEDMWRYCSDAGINS